MKFQQHPWWCGPASIQAALYFFGVRKTQREIAKRIACTPDDGTSEEEVCRAFLSWGFQVDAYGHRNEHYAFEWLFGALGPTVICVDAHEHWVCVLGIAGALGQDRMGSTRFIVFDPQNSADNKRHLGMKFYTWEQLKTRWRYKGVYYGISITQP